MAAAQLTKDMIVQPRLWRLSMEVGESHVDVVLNSLVEDHALIYRRLELDAGMTRLQAFEELIYENPLLLSDFSKVDIIIDSPRYSVAPSSISDEARLAVLEALWPDARLDVEAVPLWGTSDTLLIGIEGGLLSFLRRTFLDARLHHPVSVLANYFSPRSLQGNAGKIYAMLRPGRVDVVAFAPGKQSPLRIANSYDASNPRDAAYYILAAAQTAGFSLADDEVQLCGDPSLREPVAAELRKVANFVMPVIFPSEIFRSGREALEAPFDIVILPLLP